MEKRRAFSPDVRERVYERDGGRCYYCGLNVSPFRCTVDHITPLSKGGPNSLENLALACMDCNVRKAARTPEEWASSLRGHAWQALERVYTHIYALPGFSNEEPTHKAITNTIEHLQEIVYGMDLTFPGDLNRRFVELERQKKNAGTAGPDSVH